MRSPFSARHHLQSARQRGEEMQVINGQCPTQVPQGLGASEKPVPTPPSSAPAGGEVRRGCLSPKGEFRAGRLLGAAQGSRPKADRGWRVAFFAFFLGEARKKVARRGEIPANLTLINRKPRALRQAQRIRRLQTVESRSNRLRPAVHEGGAIDSSPRVAQLSTAACTVIRGARSGKSRRITSAAKCAMKRAFSSARARSEPMSW